MTATGMPRFADDSINLQEVLRQLAESVADEVMSAEVGQLCEATSNSRNAYRESILTTCVSTLTLRAPKLRSGSFFPEDALERYQRVDRAVVASVAEMYATGTSNRKVQRVTSAVGIERISRDQASAICASLDSEVEELSTRPFGDPHALPMARRDLREVQEVRARGVDGRGKRDRLRLGGLEARPGRRRRRRREPRLVVGVPRQGQRAGRARHEARHLRRPRGPRARGRGGLPGGGLAEVRVHLMRDCARAASSSRRTSRRVSRIVAPVFRLREASAVRAAYHQAIEMLEVCCPEAARILEEAEPDALAYLDFPPTHWKRLRTNNLQERTNREIKRRSRVVQVFPSVASLERLADAVMCDQDEAWSRSRYFSERVMSELPDEPAAATAATEEQLAAFRLVARRAIEASLELADEPGTA